MAESHHDLAGGSARMRLRGTGGLGSDVPVGAQMTASGATALTHTTARDPTKRNEAGEVFSSVANW